MSAKQYCVNFTEKDYYISNNDFINSFNPTFKFIYKFLRIIKWSNSQTKKNAYDRYNWVKSSHEIFLALESVGVKFNISGLEHLRNLDDSAVFISNHMSALETVVLPSMIQPVRPVCFIMKKELVDMPLFGPVTAARHPILVGRENPREDLKNVMLQGAERLNNGMSIIVFPQKTRSEYLDKSSFNSLGVKLAKKNNKYIVPVALLSNAWSNGKIVKDFGRIYPEREVFIEFGEPMRVEGNGSEEHNKIVEFISERFEKWGRKEFIKKIIVS